MNEPHAAPTSIELSGIDGANPLGFLAALGTLACFHAAGYRHTRLAWTQAATWRPLLYDPPSSDRQRLASIVAARVTGRRVAVEAEQARRETQRAMEQAATAIKKKRDEIKRRGLSTAQSREARATELPPLEQDYQAKRKAWLAALMAAVPSEELALGKDLDCTVEMFRNLALDARARVGLATRDVVDLLAAFGSDACATKDRNHAQILATPFYFIRGSGNQYFLQTAGQLMAKATEQAIKDTLFDYWRYADARLSMRWDPIEDRQYALLAADPAKARTQWMANLLAYRGLVFFPTGPALRELRATAWHGPEAEPTFTWPLWEHPLPPDSIRSLLLLPELSMPTPDRAALRARGVVAVYRSRRIRVGMGSNYKYNFSPARAV